MSDTTMVRLCLAAALASSAVPTSADVFNLPSGETSLQFVTVGDPGNVADPATGYGYVPYVYRMSKYDVTVGQYCQFLNAVATTGDPYGLYNSGMATDYPTIAIIQSGSPGSYSYAVTGSYSQGVNCPIFGVSWGDAARFCNWLQNGQPIGAEGNGTTETGAYTLNGGTANAALIAVTRNPGAIDFIPSENEWYKAAYYAGGGTNAGYWLYPTQSDAVPTNVFSATGTNNANYYNDALPATNGGLTDPTNLLTPVGSLVLSPGPYGTYDMGGDVWQWNEAGIDGAFRGSRGGSWFDNASTLASSARSWDDPSYETNTFGFRVASIPEPGSLALLLAGAAAIGIRKLLRKLPRRHFLQA